MKKITKKMVRERRAKWDLALKEGRIVRHNEGKTLTEYRTAAAAEAVVNALQADGLDAEIVVVPEGWEK